MGKFTYLFYFWNFYSFCVFFIDILIKYFNNKNKILHKKMWQLLIIIFTLIIVSLINPYGYKGLIFPFKIFENYGYMVFENQSVWFIEKLFKYPPILNFKIVFLVLLLSWVYKIFNIMKKKEEFSVTLFLLSLTFSVMGWLAIRNFSIFGFFAFTITSINLKKIYFKNNFIVLSIFLLISIFFTD